MYSSLGLQIISSMDLSLNWISECLTKENAVCYLPQSLSEVILVCKLKEIYNVLV